MQVILRRKHVSGYKTHPGSAKVVKLNVNFQQQTFIVIGEISSIARCVFLIVFLKFVCVLLRNIMTVKPVIVLCSVLARKTAADHENTELDGAQSSSHISTWEIIVILLSPWAGEGRADSRMQVSPFCWQSLPCSLPGLETVDGAWGVVAGGVALSSRRC